MNSMAKIYVHLNVEEEEMKDIMKVQGYLQLKSGKKVTITKVVRWLLTETAKVNGFPQDLKDLLKEKGKQA